MSTTELFQITEAEVVAELNPLSVDGLIELDGTDGVPSSIVFSHLQRKESLFADGMPEIYRAMLREVRGEILVQEATAGQTALQTGLYPIVTGTLALYLDFGKGRGSDAGVINTAQSLEGVTLLNGQGISNGSGGYTAYRYRTIRDRMPTDSYTVALTTGVITLSTALQLGQTVHADYKHTGLDRAYGLRDIVIKMAAASLGKSLPFVADNAFEQLDKMESMAIAQLLALQEGRSGVDLFDNLRLADETRTDQHQTGQPSYSLFW